MAATTVSDQAAALLGQSFAEAKIRGTPSPHIEAPAVLQSVATTLLLNPRASLYIAHLARNGLNAAILNEIALLDAVVADVRDLTNPTYNITDTSSLVTAKTSLLAMENQQRVSSSVGAFKVFDNAISQFLNKQLGPNVKAPGASALVRPSSEASSSLGPDFSALVDSHVDVLDRLYALVVGVQNFLASPLGTIIGAQTASRSRFDIERMLSEIEADPSGTNSRDLATRLITARAALRALGTQPNLNDPVLDTDKQIPAGYVVTGSTEEGTALATSSPGPFSFDSGDSLGVTVNGSTITHSVSGIAQALNQPAILGAPIPLEGATIPGDSNLFLQFFADSSQGVDFELQSDGTYTHPVLGTNWNLPSTPENLFSKIYRVPLNETDDPITLDVPAIVSLINTTLGPIGEAVEFAQAGSRRILIYGFSNSSTPYVSRINITSYGTEPDDILGVIAYATSSHESIGFTLGQVGEVGTSADILSAALSLLFSSLVDVSRNSDDSLTFETVSTATGTSLRFSGGVARAMGLNSSPYLFESQRITLSGTVAGAETSPVNPIELVDVGDVLTSAAGSSVIEAVSSTSITLTTPLSSFSGPVTVISALNIMWSALSGALALFLQSWVKTDYAQNLDKLDSAIAALRGQVTPAQQNNTLSLLSVLRAQLVALSSVLTRSDSLLPAGAGTQESDIVRTILSTFDERKYDRAKDYLLRCKIHEVFQMDYQSLSYGGNLMKTASAVARTDLKFVNTAMDENGSVKASRPRTGLP